MKHRVAGLLGMRKKAPESMPVSDIQEGGGSFFVDGVSLVDDEGGGEGGTQGGIPAATQGDTEEGRQGGTPAAVQKDTQGGEGEGTEGATEGDIGGPKGGPRATQGDVQWVIQEDADWRTGRGAQRDADGGSEGHREGGTSAQRLTRLTKACPDAVWFHHQRHPESSYGIMLAD